MVFYTARIVMLRVMLLLLLPVGPVIVWAIILSVGTKAFQGSNESIQL
jgi:hypothetical protein